MYKTTTERTIAAARRYLEMKGYEILDEMECDGIPIVVADDEDVCVFAHVSFDMGKMPSVHFHRSKFEQMAADYICDHDIADCEVRADAISMMVVGPDRALLRHTINWSNSPEAA